MSMLKDLVVCKYVGCNQVYNDARILPCGKRTCAAHIDEMVIESDNMDSNGRMIKCRLCDGLHSFPEYDKEFPVDEYIPQLLSMRYSSEHDATKKSFNDVTQLLAKMLKFNEEDYAIDYFQQVETDIMLEKDANMQKLVAHYQKLLDDVHEQKIKCLDSLKARKTMRSELNEIKQALIAYEGHLKRRNFDFVLKTLDGDEAKWRAIQFECNTCSETIKRMFRELNEKMIRNRKIEFKPNTRDIQIESICGHLFVEEATDSTILCTDEMKNDLLQLCKLSDKQFKLLYRATRDGFGASSFHAKCDHLLGTLTVSKTTKGNIFGGFTSLAWDSTIGWKQDKDAFIFSLVNCNSTPMLIPVRPDDRYTVCCHPAHGPIFGGGNDIHIEKNSDSSSLSFSNLGCSYNFNIFPCGTIQAQSFLAGSRYFRTSEIEVFQLN